MKKILPSLFFLATVLTSQAQSIDIKGPEGSGSFGSNVTVLTNGNYVITDRYWDNGTIRDVGAVYLYNGKTHELISKLTGKKYNDRIGYYPAQALVNGNFVIRNPTWDNGSIKDAGSITWCNGTTGLSGEINAENSLIGSSDYDQIGNSEITILPNGNFVVRNPAWDNGSIQNAGAITWGNGLTGINGYLNASNSLVGSSNSDQIGYEGITLLKNGNYLINSPSWDNGTVQNAGAITWCDADFGRTGVVNADNSLVGSHLNDEVGRPKRLKELINGNFVIFSFNWDNGTIVDAGAVTWCNGNTGKTGAIMAENSLVGTSYNDRIGLDLSYAAEIYMTELSNGNYVIYSPFWDNDQILDAGAVTWCNGANGTSGLVSVDNSLVGTSIYDRIGIDGVVALNNGNYVVVSPNWTNGKTAAAGAVTWGNGNAGNTIGAISVDNSLIGTLYGDKIGFSGVTALNNGNYVVSSPYWSNGITYTIGAVTWGNGATGTKGIVNEYNSLVGSKYGDMDIGQLSAFPIVCPLTNGNYVVFNRFWDNGNVNDVGAVTWCDGTIGTTGQINSKISFIGTASGEQIGHVTPLANGNYLIYSPFWNKRAAAVTWCNGAMGRTGEISSENSLIDIYPSGYSEIFIDTFNNGNYLITNPYWSKDVGAVTWGNGAAGTFGKISSSNSLIGPSRGSAVGIGGITKLSNDQYLIRSFYWNNGSMQEAGALTLCNSTYGTFGEINQMNSITGSSNKDHVGAVQVLENGNYIATTPEWDNRVNKDVGAITWANGRTGVTGPITTCNSVVGITNNSILKPVYNDIHEYLIVSNPFENMVTIFNPTGQSLAINLDNKTHEIGGIGDAVFVNDNCRLITKLKTTGTSPLSGSTTAKVWVETTQPAAYVKRHYEITPTTNADNATAKITLYFTQQEFDNFNAVNTLKLPMNSDDEAGKANLLIEKTLGVSTNGTGLPNSYTGTATTINPAEEDIIWNSLYNRWELSFEVTGIGGFFVKTTTAILPVSWLSISGSINDYQQAVISFKVNETNTANYVIEKSADSRSFNPIGNISSKGNGTNTYSFIDSAVLNGTSFFRIKQVDKDNQYSYSSTISLSNILGSALAVYPNPVKTIVSISNAHSGTEAVLADASGRTLRSIKINSSLFTIDMSIYPSGVYILKCNDGSFVKIVKE